MTHKVESVDFNELFECWDNPLWTRVAIKSMYYDFDNVVSWLNEHCGKNVKFHCAGFMFEDAQDAIMFKLGCTHVQV